MWPQMLKTAPEGTISEPERSQFSLSFDALLYKMPPKVTKGIQKGTQGDQK